VPDPDRALTVTGLTAEAIGDLAAQNSIRLHELTPQRASLEEAFMDLTRDSVEFQGGTTHEDPARASNLVPPSNAVVGEPAQ